MSPFIVTRRAALLAFGGFAGAGLSGCNTAQAPLVQPAAGPAAGPPSGYRVGAIAVDTAPLVAQSGNPTAQWAQDALPGALAQAFAGHMAPGDPGAPTLSVTINAIVLGSVGPGGQAIDNMKGVATLGGRTVRLRATSFYIPSPIDQTLVEQAYHGRVVQLSQAFAYQLARRWRR